MSNKRFSQVFNYIGDNITIGLTKNDKFKLSMNGEYTKGKGNNVTDFSNWVFNSLHNKTDRLYNQENGKELEKIIINRRTENYIRKNYGISFDWELEYNDLNQTQNKVYEISNLIFRDKKLYGKPDIVFRNKQNNDRIIIELKSSTGIYVDIPEDGWINMKCQLWSYSYIDEFKDSNNIFLVGDIHRVYYHENQIIFSHEKSPSWWFKKNGVINFSESGVKEFHNQCVEIFKIYGGRLV